jgi:hypothetical protein
MDQLVIKYRQRFALLASLLLQTLGRARKSRVTPSCGRQPLGRGHMSRYTALLLLMTILSACSVETKSMTEAAKLRAADGEANDYLGYSVSTDGVRAIVGAYGDDDRGTNAGAAYIFSTRNRKWSEEAKLLPVQASQNEQVGMAVAIDGEFAWVGSRGDIENGPQTGSAYLFRHFEDGWVQIARFRSHASNTDDQYGLSVASHKGWAVVGAYGDAEKGRDAGCVYVYKLENDVWQFSERIFAPKGKDTDYFGFSVDINGDRMIVGAFGDDTKGSRAGAAYVYRRRDEEWKLDVRLTASDGSKHDMFGHSVAISGNVAAVGAHGNDTLGRFSGAAYVFGRGQKGWRFLQKLEAPDKRANKYFGFSVDVSQKRVLVGARGDSHGGELQSGAAYLFARSGNKFAPGVKYVAQLASQLDFLGRSVAVSDGFGFAGTHGDDDAGSLSGSVYTF